MASAPRTERARESSRGLGAGLARLSILAYSTPKIGLPVRQKRADTVFPKDRNP
jgi:hypothetical protein